MSKELTKKWKSGELECGEYYLKYTDGTTDREYLDWANVYGVAQEKGFSTEPCDIEEVLAPVPTYDEWEELQESNDGLSKLMFKSLMNRFVKADEERERLEEQLKEANNLLLGFLDENICSFDHNGYCQEHSSTEPDYRCIQQQLKWYFKKYEVSK